MIYKFYLSILAFCLFTSFALAQKLVTVKGKVIDSVSKLPVSYVTVGLKNHSGTFIKSTLAKEDGSFQLENIKHGNYLLNILAVGYHLKTVSLTLTDVLNTVTDLGNIPFSTKDNQLQEVVISGNRPLVTQEVDRISYDLRADPDSKRENMLEVLRKVPLLSLDDEDNVKLKGGTDFKIFVNGRPSGVMAKNPTMALRAMRAKNVKKIEVITTPSAKYDSEGTAGIINIITNTDLEGYNLILEAFDNTIIASGVGAAFTVKKNKLGATGYIGRWFRDYPSTMTTSYRASSLGSGSRVEQDADSKPTGTSTPFNADLSYEIDSLNLLTGSVLLSLEKRKYIGEQFLRSYAETGNINYAYKVENNTYTADKVADFGLNYQLGFKRHKDMLLTASYRYSKTRSDYDNNNSTSQVFNYLADEVIQQNNSGLVEQTAQLDYIKPSKKLSIEGGIKLIARNNYSDFNTERNLGSISFLSSDAFNYDQDVYSVYNSYQLKQENWTVKAGVRLESTLVNATFITANADLNVNYINLVPSLSVQRKLNGASGINVGYTQRVLRPGILQLNPFENRSNPLIYTSGNPRLQPVISHNFDLAYNRSSKGNLNISLNYARSNNTIQEVSVLGNDQITRFNYENTGSSSVLGTNISINYPIVKRLRINVNGLVQQVWLKGAVNGNNSSNSGIQYNTSADLSYNLKNDWQLGFVVKNYGPVITLQGKTNSFVNSTFRLNKEFFKNKLGMIFNAYSIFPTYRIRTSTLITPDFYQDIRTKKLARGLYLNFYYNIGQLKEKVAKNKRNVKNDDQEKKKGDPNEL